ncbi:hypothetical protein NDU88_006198 [Pleurodeles waltl]|uniref:ribonuclease H n=1 Tax=Pleurodeles waltl TaxID=8319 RepID=A0AAV7RQJ1_PLEWA|nr:hypothetical protein NDU88_006198 [Pleurodeles waltl]
MAPQRHPRFSEEKLRVMVEEIIRVEPQLFGSQMQQISIARKMALWRRIMDSINAVGQHPRTRDDIRKRWDDLRGKVRSIAARLQLAVQRTGGGPSPPPPQLTTWKEQVLALMHPEGLTGVAGGLDSGATLSCSRVYDLSEPENRYLRDYLDDVLAKGFIHHSTSPVSSSLFFVPEKNRELRTCIGYHAVNKVTIKNRYPLPLISVLLDQVCQPTIYTKLNLRGAYHLIRVMKGDEWKTAFRTKFGLFEYTVMPFGLCNAPSEFQFFINEVLQEFPDVCIVVYIDDILIYSSSTEEHIGHVRVVHEHHLFAKLEKFIFHAPTAEFLGYVITPDEISMDRSKVPSILDWVALRSIKEVQQFLGFADFYQRFITTFLPWYLP